MLNQSGIKKEVGAATKTILVDSQNQFAVSCKLANTGVSAGADGRKIMRAGTPLEGDLKARETAFKIAVKDKKACGILLHDVDVTANNANGTCLVFGFVDESKLGSSVVSLLDVDNTDTTKVRDTLKHITFLK